MTRPSIPLKRVGMNPHSGMANRSRRITSSELISCNKCLADLRSILFQCLSDFEMDVGVS